MSPIVRSTPKPIVRALCPVTDSQDESMVRTNFVVQSVGKPGHPSTADTETNIRCFCEWISLGILFDIFQH